jgi:hypothetical protein
LGKQDPVGEYNSKLWNSGREKDKEQARKQKRKLTFISNIYVVEDPANPENEGKVKLFKYGKKIFDKVFEASNPKFPDEKPFDPFDLWEGANLKIKIKNVEGYRNYDSSTFDKQAPLFKDEKELEAVWKEETSLKEFIDPKNFKSYDELQAKFVRVLGLGDDGHAIPNLNEAGFPVQEVAAPKARAKAPKPEPELEPELEGDDSELDYFRSLAEEDDSLIA